MTSSSVEKVDVKGGKCTAHVKTKKGEETIECDVVLSAVGIEANIEGIGLEDLGIATDKGKILVNDYYQTNIPGYYALEVVFLEKDLVKLEVEEGIFCVGKFVEHIQEL